MSELAAKGFSVENMIMTAIQVPGVKVDRKAFLQFTFAKEGIDLEQLAEIGPVAAGISREKLKNIANQVIQNRTTISSFLSFAAGIPGGLAMAATIPADILQYFGAALRLAQELSYLYGVADFWTGEGLDIEKVRGQLILYCGVMFGASGAAAGVRMISSQIAKKTLVKLPQKALTKTFWYPLVKQIGKIIGIKVTKTTVAKGISMQIPFIGGLVSGGINGFSMISMANRLQAALDEACFVYTDEAMHQDLETIEQMKEEQEAENIPVPVEAVVEEAPAQGETAGEEPPVQPEKEAEAPAIPQPAPKEEKQQPQQIDEILAAIQKLAVLKEQGILTEAEFDAKKKELLSRI